MASDMMVALARTTQDGHVYFGHNSNRPRADAASLVRTPARSFAPGESVERPWVHLPQSRHTWAVLAGRAGTEWGYQHGVNEKGVAVGATPVRTRVEAEAPGLTGADLVRLTLERATSASQAIEILTDLIGRYGQGAFAGVGSDSAFLVADSRAAYVVEAAGRHWALAEVQAVRAATGTCLLRQDWDRISRGISDFAIDHGWWPQDGCKLDFAGALGEPGPEHPNDLLRWGRATMRLEQHSGHLDAAFLRELLRDQAALLAPEDDTREVQTAASLLVRLGSHEQELPVCWYAFATPSASVYFPMFVAADVPIAFADEAGRGSRVWRTLRGWQEEARRDPRLRSALQSGLAGLQERLDDNLREFLPDANDLHRRGDADGLRRLAGSFMQHCLERFEELAAALQPRSASSVVAPQEELIEAW